MKTAQSLSSERFFHDIVFESYLSTLGVSISNKVYEIPNEHKDKKAKKHHCVCNDKPPSFNQSSKHNANWSNEECHDP